MNDIYLENNIFSNVVSDADGVAVHIRDSKASLTVKKNKFINLMGTGASQRDGSIFVSSASQVFLVENEFINCSNEASVFYSSIVNIGSSVSLPIFEKNSFINSSHSSNGNFYSDYGIENLNFEVTPNPIEIGNSEINQGADIIINLTDDVGNIVKTNLGMFLSGEDNYTVVLQNKNGLTYHISFSTVPENGIYNVTFGYNYHNEYYNYSGAVATVNVQANNDPIDVWVSPEGNDENNGTHDNPFKTIEIAITKGFSQSFTVNVHLIKGIYSGNGNVNLTISNKGNLNLIGEVYNETIIDGEHANWFIRTSTTLFNVENIKFVNGGGNGVILQGEASRNLALKNCIVDNCVANGGDILSYVNFDKLVFTNNRGRIFYFDLNEANITNSYFANNDANGQYSFLYLQHAPTTIEHCFFINNTGSVGVAYSTVLISKNNYYESNHGNYAGVFGLNSASFENDTFINNDGVTNGVLSADKASFIGCKFINNSGEIADVFHISQSNTNDWIFDNCSFINNTGGKGSLVLTSFGAYNLREVNTIQMNDVIFENNGVDIYLSDASPISSYVYAFPIVLTINFDNVTIDAFDGTLTASVYGPCGAIINGGTLNFIFDGSKIGSCNIVNSKASIDYSGFLTGVYNLTGDISNPSFKNIINNGTVNVSFEAFDHLEYWVSNQGSDESGDGSQNNPFRSISHSVYESLKHSRDIVIHIDEGTYEGDLNTNVLVPCVGNITLIGAGLDKTIIDGNKSNFVNITIGAGIIKLSDMTIRNCDNPIIIDQSILYLNNLNITRCTGQIIDGSATLFIDDSFINYNYVSRIFETGNLNINNTLIEFNLLRNIVFGGILDEVMNVVINNSVFRNNFIPANGTISNDLLIWGYSAVIENTIFNFDGNLSILDSFDMEAKYLKPAVLIVTQYSNLTNVSFINDYEGEIHSTNSISAAVMYISNYFSIFCFDNVHQDKHVNVKDSTFVNIYHIITYSGDRNSEYMFDNCIFENISSVIWGKSTQSSTFSFSNSIFVSSYIGKETGKAPKNPSTFIFEHDYWGNNSRQKFTELIPKSTISLDNWLVLKYEGDGLVWYLNDTENLTKFDAQLPVSLSYIAYEGSVVPVININGDGYLFEVDDDGNVILAENAIRNIVPKVEANETVFADNLTVTVNDGTQFVVLFTDKWGDPLVNTEVTCSAGLNVFSNVTDENGIAKFDINLKPGSYIVNTVNPATKQSILNKLEIETDNSIFANDVIVVYDDGSVFYANFTDRFGNALSNANVTFIVDGTPYDVVSDENGTASFNIDLNGGVWNVSIINNATGQSIIRSITVNKQSTKITAPAITTVYNVGKTLVVTLKDANGKAIVNKNVVITLNGVKKSILTDKSGKVKLAVNLPAKKYTASVKYAGDDNYVSASANVKVVVNKAAPKLTASKKTFKAKVKVKKYTVALKTNKGKALNKVKVTLKIKGKKYTATVKKGKATFNIKKLTKKGKYTAKVSFAGNSNYKAVSKSVKITIK